MTGTGCVRTRLGFGVGLLVRWRWVAGLALAAWLVLIPAGAAHAATELTQKEVFTHSGGCTVWGVPTAVTSLRIDAVGEAGGLAAPGVGGLPGGAGDGVTATVKVQPTERLRVCVGYGGGAGGSQAGNGGGASSVEFGVLSRAATGFLVAGGGGGPGARTWVIVNFTTKGSTQGWGGAAGDPNAANGEGGCPRTRGRCPGRDDVFGRGGKNDPYTPGAGGLGGGQPAASGESGLNAGNKLYAGTKIHFGGAGANEYFGVGGGGGGAGYAGGGGGGFIVFPAGSPYFNPSHTGGGGGGTDACGGRVQHCHVDRGVGTKHAAGTAPGDAKVVIEYDQPRPVQFLAATKQGAVYHSALSQLGTWNLWKAPPHVPADVVSVAATPDGYLGETQYLVLTRSGHVYHSVRYADGRWQPSWQAPPGIPADVVSVAATYNGHKGQSEYLVATRSGHVYHSIRYSDRWQPFWDAPPGAPTDAVSVAATNDGHAGETQYLVGTHHGRSYHSIRHANGGWEAWEAPPRIPNGATRVAATSDGEPGETQYLAATSLSVYHAIRHANGTWTAWVTPPGIPYGPISIQSLTDFGVKFAPVAATTDGKPGETQYVVVTTSAVYHSTRHANGTWEAWTTPPGIPADVVSLAATQG